MGDTTTVGGNSSSSEAVVEEVSRLAEQARELQDSAASLISRTSRDEDSLRQRANSLNSNIQRLRSSIRKSNLDSKLVEKVIKISFIIFNVLCASCFFFWYVIEIVACLIFSWKRNFSELGTY